MSSSKSKSVCIVIILSVLLSLVSCEGGSTAVISGTDISMRYASLLSLTQGEGYVVADVRNPWGKDSTSLLHRYVLVPRDVELSHDLPQGEVVRIPLQKAVIYTSVHASLINQLGGYDAIKGVCDSRYMYLDKIQRDVRSGAIIDCGEGANPDIEKIIDLNPDAVMLSPFENSGSYGRLGKLGIPLIECADYMEDSALGRAEWMRFYGLLVGHGERADSLFAAIEKDYNDVKALVAGVTSRPTVVAEKKFGASWYVSGGNSTVGKLFADAGADYIFKDEKASGSVPYDPELVFDRSQQADLWLIKYNQAVPLTYGQLAEEWGNYSNMKAFRQHNVYACNLSKVPFYEETPFHPDLLLKEYVKIFHPEALKDYTLRYYKKM